MNSDPPQKKAKRQLTPEQLEKLAHAREKANAVRKEKANAKKKEKELLQMKAKQREQEVDDEIASMQPIQEGEKVGKVNPKSPPKQRSTQRKPKQEEIESSDSETDSSSSSESSSEDSSSEEEEIVYRRERKKKSTSYRKKAKSRPRETAPTQQTENVDHVYNQRMQQAFGSLFPQY